MMTIQASAWPQPATYDNGKWSTPDALIGRFLNNACVPDNVTDEEEALAMVEMQFTGIKVLPAQDAMPAAADYTVSDAE